MTDPLLIRGTLDLLVLKLLVPGPLNGYEITRQLEARSGGALDVEDSAFYQAVHRMELRDLIEAEWRLSEKNRRARYYRITREGRQYLRAETKRWLRSAGVVAGILAPSAADA
jgi:PadR family transcriptional regulator PadR